MAELQKILDHSGVVGNDPIGSLVHLGLARGYALSGDNAKARTAYQDFFTLLKDADPDIPILKQAKVEYAKLKGEGVRLHRLLELCGLTKSPFVPASPPSLNLVQSDRSRAGTVIRIKQDSLSKSPRGSADCFQQALRQAG